MVNRSNFKTHPKTILSGLKRQKLCPEKLKKKNAKSQYFSVFHANKVKKYISILCSL
jgi:hypothetical protein